MTQMVLIKEWLAYHVWIRRPVCPKVRLVTALLLPETRRDRNQRLREVFNHDWSQTKRLLAQPTNQLVHKRVTEKNLSCCSPVWIVNFYSKFLLPKVQVFQLFPLVKLGGKKKWEMSDQENDFNQTSSSRRPGIIALKFVNLCLQAWRIFIRWPWPS